MGEHAVLSASASHRWIHCPPSVKLGETFPDTKSEYSAEGTDAHALAEHKVKKLLKQKTRDPRKKLKFLTEEMEVATDAYAGYVLEFVSDNADVLIEQKLDFSDYVAGGFGTGDAVIISDGTMHIIDLKYGKGVPVKADNNSQLMCYALGGIQMFGCLYDFDTVSLHIFQPRLPDESVFTISVAELLSWAENTLKPAAVLAAEGGGEFSCGEWCRFCRAKAVCRKRAEENMKLARYDFVPPASLEDTDIEAVLSRADDLVAWAADVKEYALKQALSGKAWNGFKVVEGRSVRRYTDEEAVAKAVQAEKLDPYEHKLLGITAMTKLLGRTRFDELLGQFIEKPQGKPALVPLSDKRPPMNSAAEDFDIPF